MFRELRRNKQLLSQEQSVSILEKGTAGVLALSGDEGYPYAVPISYVYKDNRIFFHSAVSGHKIDAVKRSDKVSFCVIDRDCVYNRRRVRGQCSETAMSGMKENPEGRSINRALTFGSLHVRMGISFKRGVKR